MAATGGKEVSASAMGGLGSGRRPRHLDVGDCRRLELGELLDGGRWWRSRRGEVRWCALVGGELRGRLTYEIAGAERDAAELLLIGRYWPTAGVFSAACRIALVAAAGRRPCAVCPTCGVRVRSLYAPPGSQRLVCRFCAGLVYRRSRAESSDVARVQAAVAPALRSLAALPAQSRRSAPRIYVARPPTDLAAELASELPLGPQETRLWCLRLRAAGLSYRQIAVLLDVSKSSVARICCAGRGGIDMGALVRERLPRSWRLPRLSESGNLRAELAVLQGAILRAGFYGYAAPPREEQVVLFGDEAR